MTKAKVTNKGNVQVTMTHDQFLIIHNLMERVRLGFNDRAKESVSRFLEDLNEFMLENYVSGDEFTYGVTLENDTFTLEIAEAE